MKTRILSWFSAAEKVVETYVIIISVNIEADQIRTCVDMHVCIWLEGYWLGSVVLPHFLCCQRFSFKDLSYSRYLNCPKNLNYSRHLNCLGMNFNL